MKKYILAAVVVSAPFLIGGGLVLNRWMGFREYEALIERGDRLIGSDTFRALAAYTEAVNLRPERSLAYIQRSKAHVARGEQEEAIRDLEQAIERKPDNPGPHVTIGDMYLHAGEFEKASQEYDKAFQLGMVRAPLQYKYAYTMFALSNFEKALEYAQKALEQNSEMGEAARLAGTVYMAQGETEKAEEPLQKAVRQLAEKDRPYEELGVALYDQNKYKEALEVFQQAIEVQGKSYGLYVRAARCLAMMGDREGAMRQIGLAIAIDDKQSAGYVELARIWVRVSEEKADPNANAKALAALEQAQSLAPGNSQIYFLQGRIYEISKDYRRAMEAYTHASRLWPTVPEAYEQMAAVSIASGNRPEAEKYIQKASMLKAKSPAVFSFYGRYLVNERRYAEAIEKIKTAIGLNPRNVGYYVTLSEAQRLSGRPDEARETLRRALEIEPGNADAAAALRKLGA